MTVSDEIRKSPESDHENKAVGARLKEVMSGMITIKAAAETVGVTEKTVQRWLKGENSVDVGSVITICRKVSADPAYVLTGAKSAGDWRSALPAVAADERRLPVYDVYASAGGGAEVLEDKPTGFVHFPSAYADRLGAPDQLEIIRVSGDSMEPTFKAGDQVMVDKSAPHRDGLYVVKHFNQVKLKRVHFLGAGQYKLISDNISYPTEEVKASDLAENDFSVVGRVVWTGRAL